MKRSLAALAGALGLAGAYRALKHRPQPAPALPEPGPDPRAEELRRAIEHATPVAEPAPAPAPAPAVEPDDEARRRAVHERARAAIDEMRRPAEDAET